MFFSAPIVGKLMTRVDPRWMIAVGFFGFGLGTWQAHYITRDWDFYELLIPQILRGSSLMLCMVPINNLALGTLPNQQLKNASALYNLMRNLGGAVGLALINTVMNDRWDLHLQRLHESVSWTRPVAIESLNTLTQAFTPRLGSDAELAALKQLSQMVRQQAFVMAIGDVFFALTSLFVILILLTPLMRRPARMGGGGDSH
jgi:DHA2 family multidrug resistance protein